MFCRKYTVFLTMVLLEIIPASGFGQFRQFVVPTTYPVPTKTPTYPIPTNTPPLINSLLTSVPVRCPLKREIGDGRRLVIDDDLMRQIYRAKVGRIDSRYLAETMEAARETFHRSHSWIMEQPNVVRNGGLFNHIKHWLLESQANRTTDVRNIEKGKRHNKITDEHKSNRNFGTNIRSTVKRNRVRRNADGSISHVEYCHPRGDKTPDGYLHMCASCALTTVLPDDKFPRYINEASCDATDCDCITARGIPNGKCIPRIQYVKMLRKLPKGCRLTIHSGQQVITDNWEIYDHPLKVGCECVMNKLSAFATFVPKPSG